MHKSSPLRSYNGNTNTMSDNNTLGDKKVQDREMRFNEKFVGPIFNQLFGTIRFKIVLS